MESRSVLSEGLAQATLTVCQNEQTKKNSIFYSNVYHTILLGDFFFVNYIVEFKQVYL